VQKPAITLDMAGYSVHMFQFSKYKADSALKILQSQ